MYLSYLLDVLASTEMELARFNAHRTSSSPDAEISLGSGKHLRWITDSSRVESTYYNRALTKRVGELSPEALDELPISVAAVELRPSETSSRGADVMLAAGFRPVGTLCYLAMRPPRERLTLTQPVRQLPKTQTDLFFDLLESAGTPFPRERRASKACYYCTDEFQSFVVEESPGSALGWSTMFRSGNFAYLGNSYTKPEARCRGVQSALLAARLNAAAAAGAEPIFTDVEHGSQSHANCERIGFRAVTVNTIWERRT